MIVLLKSSISQASDYIKCSVFCQPYSYLRIVHFTYIKGKCPRWGGNFSRKIVGGENVWEEYVQGGMSYGIFLLSVCGGRV